MMATVQIELEEFRKALCPLLSNKGLQLFKEHVEALEAMGGNSNDRTLATCMRFLLENHAARKAAWEKFSEVKP